MKRISMGTSFIRLGLALVLLAAQFGCATSFKNIPAAQVTPDADPKVKLPASQKMNAEETKAIFSELKGKRTAFFPNDPRFAPIAGRLEDLEGRMVAKSIEDARSKNKYAAYGGLFLPLGLLLLVGTMESGGDPVDFKALAEAYWLLTLPAQILVGAAAGFIGAEVNCGPEIDPEHQTQLLGIVVDYNALVDEARAQEKK